MTAVTDATAGGHGRSAHEELGRLNIHDRVVEKIAARAAGEIAEAGSATPRVLGRSLPGAGRFGIRRSDLDAAAKASAHIEGSVTRIELSISVRWPACIPEVTALVRDRVRTRVSDLTGLRVQEVGITVTDLVTDSAAGSRVR
ncbi:Asp23/Gls24 family envelope stress response protein [Micromonospora sp. NPDC048999]|uniref:Asp23/Gls24 family envelope stress response protein n=1 Tax=Micromonospora sp. NPDC048999 TaxID=3155391 RepID=UPI0033D06E42